MHNTLTDLFSVEMEWENIILHLLTTPYAVNTAVLLTSSEQHQEHYHKHNYYKQQYQDDGHWYQYSNQREWSRCSVGMVVSPVDGGDVDNEIEVGSALGIPTS